jgi:hypothetical protein
MIMDVLGGWQVQRGVHTLGVEEFMIGMRIITYPYFPLSGVQLGVNRTVNVQHMFLSLDRSSKQDSIWGRCDGYQVIWPQLST